MDHITQGRYSYHAVRLEQQVLHDDSLTEQEKHDAIDNIQLGLWIAISRVMNMRSRIEGPTTHIIYQVPGRIPFQWYEVNPYVTDEKACTCPSRKRQMVTFSLKGTDVPIYGCKHVLACILNDLVIGEAMEGKMGDEDVVVMTDIIMGR
jgi:hypothetical protein